jgi:hypothetical protein
MGQAAKARHWKRAASMVAAAVFVANGSCSRSSAEVLADAASAPVRPSASAAPACSTHDQLASQVCRTGARQVDKLPAAGNLGLELSHCPLDDCGSGGCTYDVYSGQPGCLRKLGSVHGAWIDVAPSTPSTPPSLRTWGRSGTTHIATEYDIEGGGLVKRRQFTCDYGSGKPLPAECPKL